MSLYTAYPPFDLQRELYRIIHEVGLLCNGAIKYVVLVLFGRFESEIVLEFLNLVLWYLNPSWISGRPACRKLCHWGQGKLNISSSLIDDLEMIIWHLTCLLIGVDPKLNKNRAELCLIEWVPATIKYCLNACTKRFAWPFHWERYRTISVCLTEFSFVNPRSLYIDCVNAILRSICIEFYWASVSHCISYYAEDKMVSKWRCILK